MFVYRHSNDLHGKLCSYEPMCNYRSMNMSISMSIRDHEKLKNILKRKNWNNCSAQLDCYRNKKKPRHSNFFFQSDLSFSKSETVLRSKRWLRHKQMKHTRAKPPLSTWAEPALAPQGRQRLQGREGNSCFLCSCCVAKRLQQKRSNSTLGNRQQHWQSHRISSQVSHEILGQPFFALALTLSFSWVDIGGRLHVHIDAVAVNRI